jgi:glutamine synthetase
MSHYTLAEYLWLDGAEPTRQIRSKTRAINVGSNPSVEDFPDWSFDGSSTNQAEGRNSDCLLQPVSLVRDPIRGDGNFIVMCEVNNPDGTAHASNSRAQLRKILDAGAGKTEPWVGFEQEYTLFKNSPNPLGWPEDGFPAPQGPYYCGVGSREVFGRELAEKHAKICLEAGIAFYGINAEVMPGQWEFQVGYRGEGDESGDALKICDQTWIARWLLRRLGEDFDYYPSFDNKPIPGDWNGAGLHTNFSTNDTRDPKKGMAAIDEAVERLSHKHAEHIELYGAGLSDRLTGLHETSDIDTFKAGTADRGCSIRIPQPVAAKGYGYFEDRRPGANADPYLVAARICATVSAIDESLFTFTSWPRRDDESEIQAA